MKARAPKTIVSVTPLPIRADSRTLKQASSVGRLGYRSIAVEGTASGTTVATPFFELVSAVPVETPKPAASDARQAASTSATTSEEPAGTADDSDPDPAEPKAPEAPQSDGSEGSTAPPARKRVRRAIERLPYGDSIISALWHMEQVVKGKPVGAGQSATSSIKENARTLVEKKPRIVQTAERLGHKSLRLTSSMFGLIYFFNRYMWQYLFAPVRKIPKADIYYLHHFYHFPSVYVKCIRHKAKFVYDAHDFYSDMELNEDMSYFWRNWVLPWERWLERRCVKRAAAVVTVNEGIAALMRDRFGCEPIILRNAHDSRLDRPVARTIREAIGLADDDFLIVSIGNWKAGMAIQSAFAALQSLPDRYHLAFLGGNYPSYEEALQDAGLQGRVHFLPPVLPEEVVPFIASADASIILYFGSSPNYQNALPNRFFQAVAAGLPLIYPPLTEIRRLGERHGLGLMTDPQDSLAVAAAIRELGEGSSGALTIRQHVLEAQTVLGWEHEERELKALLEKLVGDSLAVANT